MVYLIVIIYYLGTGEIVPTPPSITAENTNNSKLGINSQKLILLRRGNAMSGPPTSKGNKKFIFFTTVKLYLDYIFILKKGA